MSKYLTDRLNAVFIETSLIRKQALDTAEAAGLHRGTALREASYAARKALREADRRAAQIKSWGALAALHIEYLNASFIEGTPENDERMRQRNRQVAAMKGRA